MLRRTQGRPSYQVALSLRRDHVTSCRAMPYTTRAIVLVSGVQPEEEMLGPIWLGVQLSSGDFMFTRNASVELRTQLQAKRSPPHRQAERSPSSATTLRSLSKGSRSSAGARYKL